MGVVGSGKYKPRHQYDTQADQDAQFMLANLKQQQISLKGQLEHNS